MNDEVATMKDISARELTLFLPIVFMAIWLGIYPKPYSNAMEPSVAQLLKQVTPVVETTKVSKK